jgi:hypothetical protein
MQLREALRLVFGPGNLMRLLVSQLALTPYLTPFQPDNNYLTPSIDASDTLQTFFLELGSMLVSERELSDMLQMMDQNIVHILHLQSDRLNDEVKPNLHDGMIGKFISLLADPSVHLYSLVPIPKLGGLELKKFVASCVQMRIAPDRSAWAIHHFVKRSEISPEVLTNCLIGEPTF